MGKRSWSHGYTVWVEKIVREAREAGDTRTVNKIRFDPKYKSPRGGYSSACWSPKVSNTFRD